MDPFVSAIEQAALPYVGPVIGAAFTLLIAWLGHRTALYRAANTAVSQHGDNTNEAEAAVSSTLAGKFSTKSQVGMAVRAARRRSSPSPG